MSGMPNVLGTKMVSADLFMFSLSAQWKIIKKIMDYFLADAGF